MIVHPKYKGENMIKKEKMREISGNLVMNDVEFPQAFRQNLFKYVEAKEITMAGIAKDARMPTNTLNSFLYGKSNDMKLSNVIRIAKALNVSIDELVGAGTIPELTRESLKICRNLPHNDLELIRWFIRYLDKINQDLEPNKRYISVMMPLQTNDGNFEITADYKKVEITDLKEPLRSKIFMGFHIICDHYMPYYGPGDVILIANDRKPTFTEHAVVRVGKYLFIIKRIVENGIAKYYSIRDGKYRIDEEEVDELIGYIAAKIPLNV